ncbi:unnamed protein product, partial [Amoebophrya sp. A25]
VRNRRSSLYFDVIFSCVPELTYIPTEASSQKLPRNGSASWKGVSRLKFPRGLQGVCWNVVAATFNRGESATTHGDRCKEQLFLISMKMKRNGWRGITNVRLYSRFNKNDKKVLCWEK